MALLLALGLASVIPSQARADDPPRDLSEISIEELVQVKVATVYGASKHDQKVTEAPASVTIVTAEEIRLFGYRTLADIVNGVRGFYVTNDRNYGFIGVRGLGRPGDFGGRVLLLVDGHRQNDPFSDSAFNVHDFILDVDLIERVEIVRGPGSSLYGNNAFFAVIDVITRAGAAVNGLELSGAAGSHEAHQGRVTAGKRFDNGIEALISASGYSSDGEEEIFFPELAAEQSGGFSRDDDGESATSAFSSFSWSGFSLRGGYVSRKKDVPSGAFDTVLDDPRFESIDARAFVSIGHEHTFENGTTLRARLYYDVYEYDAAYPAAEALNRDEVRTEWWGGEVSLARRIFDVHRVTLGTEFRDDFRLDQKNFDVGSSELIADTRRSAESFAFFFQDEFSPREDLIFNVGARYDHYSTFGSTINPRLALIWLPFTETAVKLIYGRAFRAPNFDEFFYESPTQRRNPDLDAESIAAHELVIEHYLPKGVRLTGSLYLNRVDDLVDQREEESGLVVFENGADLESRGLEVEIDGRFAPGVITRASYALQKTENRRTDANLSNSPRHLIKGQLGVPILADRLGAGIEILHSSSVETLTGASAGAYTLVGVTLSGSPWPGVVDASVSVFDLFDDDHAFPASGEHRQDVIPQDGRTFRGKVTVRF